MYCFEKSLLVSITLACISKKSGSGGLQLESARFGDGVILTGTGGQEVNYFLTDHLGSVRVIVDGSGVVKERNDYYPFGARHVKADYPRQAVNRFKYNGKEEQVTGDLGYFDYGARMYDGAIGRWFGVDPLLEKCFSISSYAYCVNSPMKYIDPNGETIKFYYQTQDRKGNFIMNNGFRNSTIRFLWEKFAMTQEGFAFLALFAEAGQTIGGVRFEEDGPLSYFNLNVYDFDYGLKLGSFREEMLYKAKKMEDDRMYFRLEMNSENVINAEGKADYLVTLGHELFIHMQQWYMKFIKAYTCNDVKEYNRLHEVSSKNGGDYDHSRYINGNEAYQSFTTYLNQLKKMNISPLTPQLIDNAKKRHDNIYEKFKKNHDKSHK